MKLNIIIWIAFLSFQVQAIDLTKWVEGFLSPKVEEDLLEGLETIEVPIDYTSQWQGRFCRSSYLTARGNLTTNLDIPNSKIKIHAEGSLGVRARLKNTEAEVFIASKIDYSLCRPVRVKPIVRVDLGEIEAAVKFGLDENGRVIPTVNVARIELMDVKFSSYLPDSVERFLKERLNRAIRTALQGKLGTIINQKINEYLASKAKP